MALVLDSTSKKKLLLLKELALEMGVKVTEMPISASIKPNLLKDNTVSKNELMADIETSFKQLKEKKNGKIKFNSVEMLLNEK